MTRNSYLALGSFVLSLLTGVVLGRGNAAETPTATEGKRPLRIGLSLATLNEERWTRDRDAFVARAKELGAEVTVLSANSDNTRQIADIESLVTNKVDVIVAVPHDGKAMAKAVEIAHKAGIPIIPYDRLIVDSEPDLYVTFDNRVVGQQQAKYLLEALKDAPKPIKMVRIYGSKTDNNAVLFKLGQDDILKDAIADGRVQVIGEDWADDWKPEVAKRIMNAALTKHGKAIDAVLASNDGTAGGAIQALSEEGIAGKVLVTGQDADKVAVQRIVCGQQAMTIYKPVKLLAPRAAEVAVAMAKHKPVVAKTETNNGKIEVPTIALDVLTVTRANVNSVLVAGGVLTKEEVTAGCPNATLP
jgi:D-xylose transport system substrate-binding protein